MQQNKVLSVSAIKNGTVIDHIYGGQALNIIRILNLASEQKTVTIGLNLAGKNKKFKDIVKVTGQELTTAEIDKVAILAPEATINIIRGYKIIKKFRVTLPDIIDHVIICPNPKCITNNDNTDTVFKVLLNNFKLKLQCHYCEKIFKQSEIREYKNN